MILFAKKKLVRGMTLLELTVAILILTMVMLPLLETETAIRRRTLEIVVRRQLEVLANNKLEEKIAGIETEMSGLFYDSAGNPIGNGSYEWEIEIIPRYLPTDTLPQEFYDDAEYDEPTAEDIAEYPHVKVLKVTVRAVYTGVGKEKKADASEFDFEEDDSWREVVLETIMSWNDDIAEDLEDVDAGEISYD